jgi:hypothetical protein
MAGVLWLWAELGEAPLACALKHLAIIAEYTKNSLASGSMMTWSPDTAHLDGRLTIV